MGRNAVSTISCGNLFCAKFWASFAKFTSFVFRPYSTRLHAGVQNPAGGFLVRSELMLCASSSPKHAVCLRRALSMSLAIETSPNSLDKTQ